MKKLSIVCCSLLLLVNTLYAQKDTSILVGVEYFNGWWKESPNKWERQGKDWRAQYPERIPLLGEYNSQETMDKEIEAASGYGVDFFSILWYYPGQLKDKGACDFLNAGLNQFMNSPNSGKMKFMVELCNHSPFAIITDEDWDKCMDVCIKAMKHESYLRVDGRAVVKIHGGDQFHIDNGSDVERSAQIIQGMRKRAREVGIGELLITVGTYGNKPVDGDHVFVQAGIDGTMQYMDPTVLPQMETDYSYDMLVARAKEMRDLRKNDAIPWVPYFPAGWNPRPWGDPRAAFSLPTRKEWKSSLKELKEDMRKSSNLGFPRKDGTTQKAFTIYAWNEYGEGGMLAPTVGDQYMKLEVIQEVFGNE
jgi:hypothetical protein